MLDKKVWAKQEVRVGVWRRQKRQPQGAQGRRGLRRHCGAPFPVPGTGANDFPLSGAGTGLTATPGSPRSRGDSRRVRQHQRPTHAWDHGHRLVGPGGGRAGSGGRVGELSSAVKGSEGQFWPGIRYLGKDTPWAGQGRDGMSVGMEPGPWAGFVYPLPRLLKLHKRGRVLPSIKSPAACLSSWNPDWS